MVNTPKCTYTHTCILSDGDTHLQKQGHAIDIFTKCSLCKPNIVGSSAVSFQRCRRFSVSLLPLSSSQSFLKVHICQWFVNQPAKFTTLRSNVFLFLVVLHVNLACCREQRRKICKAVKITPPFTWCWKRPFHSFTERAGGKYLSMQVKKMSTNHHTHTLKTVKTAFSDHSRPTYTWTYCRLFPVYIKNKYTPMCM